MSSATAHSTSRVAVGTQLILFSKNGNRDGRYFQAGRKFQCYRCTHEVLDRNNLSRHFRDAHPTEAYNYSMPHKVDIGPHDPYLERMLELERRHLQAMNATDESETAGTNETITDKSQDLAFVAEIPFNKTEERAIVAQTTTYGNTLFSNLTDFVCALYVQEASVLPTGWPGRDNARGTGHIDLLPPFKFIDCTATIIEEYAWNPMVDDEDSGEDSAIGKWYLDS